MKILVFDVETTGLPKKRNASVFELSNWPYIVQFSWMIYDISESKITSVQDFIIKLPDNITIPDDSIKIHGITNEMSKNGYEIKDILYVFMKYVKRVDMVVAHNIEFDKNIVSVETVRNFGVNMWENIKTPEFCTMKKCTSKYSRWLRLEALHEKMFNTKPIGTHNSLNDIFICFRCFIQKYINQDIFKNEKFMKHKDNQNFISYYRKTINTKSTRKK